MTQTLDIDELIRPIEGADGAGTDLREDGDPDNAYWQIRTLRGDARDAERDADESDGSPAEAEGHWRDLWKQGQNYLATQAKDLEVVGWMIEASLRTGGLPALTDSLRLTKRLVEDFWGELLPTPDEDGLETTVLPIGRLNGDAILYALMRVDVTADVEDGPFKVWQVEHADRVSAMAIDEQQERSARGEATLDKLERAASATPESFYAEMPAQITAARLAIEELEKAFEDRVEDDICPRFNKFTEGLEEIERAGRRLGGIRWGGSEVEEEVSDEAAPAADGSAPAAAAAPQQAGAINSREDAFRAMEKAAQWFEKHEPQSILPMEIRKCIRRGQMKPEDLFKDLMPDEDSVLERLFRDIGVQAPADDDD